MFGKSKAALRREVRKLTATVAEQRRHLNAAGADYALVKRERAEWRERAERTGDDRVADTKALTVERLKSADLVLQVAAKDLELGKLRALLYAQQGRLDAYQAASEAADRAAQPALAVTA
ncbi:hypothetical protein [Kitasatospora sp. NPDC057223]|uniref:hypothetical protein n=1 Tax=Kitasatospora sp. NPDC057223 TaxID=3346055 RepID=UPI003636ED4F